MNKKTIIIIIVAVVILILIGAGVFFYIKKPSTGENNGIFSLFFPSDTKKEPNFPTNEQTNENQNQGNFEPGTGQEQPKRDLIQIVNTNVAGAAYNKLTKKIRYFEKSTGNLFEIDATGDNKKQLSITTIPKIFEVDWLGGASGAMLRYFDQSQGAEINSVKNMLIPAFPTATTTKLDLEATFLSSNVKSLVSSPSEQKMFYLTGEDSSVGFLASFKNKDQKQIFSSAYGDFVASWPKKDTITLLTKPSFSINGFLYKLDTKTQSFSKILGPIRGLTAILSPISDKILYSESESTMVMAKIYDTKAKTTKNFNYRILPEKCVFSSVSQEKIYCAVPKSLPKGEYPDDWYKGKFYFSDSFWVIDLDKGTTDQLKEADFDAINLFMDSDENYLFFQDKKDGTLWSLRIKE